MMALDLAAILLAAVIATAAKPQSPVAAQVEVLIELPAPEALLIGYSNMTTRAKIPLQRTPPLPAYEITSMRDQGAVWDQSPTYDLTSTSRASIYVFYTPETGK